MNLSFNKHNMRYRGPIESRKYNQLNLQVKYSVDVLMKQIEENKEKINELINIYYLNNDSINVKGIQEQNGIIQDIEMSIESARRYLNGKEILK